MKDSSSMSHSSSKEEDEVIDLSLVLRKLAQQKAVIITGCLLGIALAVLLHLFSPPLYRAIATLEVRPQKNELFGETLSSGDLAINSVNEAEMETAAAKLTRDAFLTLVSNHPSIVSCENLIPKDNGFLSGEYTSSTERKEIFLSWFRKESIKVMPRPGTLLLDITVEHRDPRSASIIANTILEVALDEARKSRGDESTTMIDELVQDYKELATRLSISRTRLSVYDDAKKLRQEILEGRSDVSLLKGRYKSKHPSMIAATSKVAQLEILLREEIEAIRVSPSEKDYWDSNLSENEGSHGHFIPFLDARLAFLDSEVKNLSETYNSVVAEAAAAQIANDTTS
ncbi:MAG: Wzz/FepE/Etk N-terminal domain-containing protein, partial [Verrucomicrobiota bacterium]